MTKSPTGTVYTSQPIIGFQLDRPSRVNLIRVTLDGNAIAPSSLNQLTNASFNFRYYPLPPGRHRVRVWGQTNGGIAFDLSWAFVTAVQQ